MHTATATIYPTPATRDAGRQPFSYTPFNTPNTKTKKSVRDKKPMADDVFCPQATSTPRRIKIPSNRVKPNDSETTDDDDVPLAVVMKLRSASLARRPSTVKRVGAIRRRRVEVDDDEDLPLSKVKERLMKSNVRPLVKRVLHRQPPTKPKPVVQTVRNLAPTSTPMMCVVPNCPYDWHVHANTVSL